MAQIVSNIMEVHKREFILHPFFKDITEKSRQLSADKQIEFTTDFQVDDHGLSLDSDPELITRVLNILLDNAIKFTARKTRLIHAVMKAAGLGSPLQVVWLNCLEASCRFNPNKGRAMYLVIFMPQQISISADLMGLLTNYVEQGGRLVGDMPLAYFDEYAALFYSNKGSPFERLFGTTINDFQYSGVNAIHFIDDMELKGFVINQTPSTAKVLAKYYNGLPAITENSLGSGKAIALGYQASMICFEPGNDQAENQLLRYVLGGRTSPYFADGALVYRLATPDADHYFLINDGDGKSVNFSSIFSYQDVVDAVTGEQLQLGAPILLERDSGRWLRFGK